MRERERERAGYFVNDRGQTNEVPTVCGFMTERVEFLLF